MGSYDPTDFESVKAAMARCDTIQQWALAALFVPIVFCLATGRAGPFMALMGIGIPTILVTFAIWRGYLAQAKAMICQGCGKGLAPTREFHPPRPVCRKCGLKVGSARHGKTVPKARMGEINALNAKAQRLAWVTGLVWLALFCVVLVLPFRWAPVLVLPLGILGVVAYLIVQSMFIDPNAEPHDH